MSTGRPRRQPPARARRRAAKAPAAATPPPAAPPAPRTLALGERLAYRSVYRLAISPDGARLCLHLVAHEAALNRQRARLLLVDAASGQARWLTNGPDGDGLPAFTPDGRRVLFVSRRKLPGRDFADCRRALWQIAIEGGEAELVRQHDTDIASFTLSADGRRVAFLARDARPPKPDGAAYESPRWLRAQAAPLRCFVLDLPARTLRRVRTPPTAHVTDMAFSPDGRRLALAAWPTAQPNDGWRGRVFLAELPPVAAAPKKARKGQRRPPAVRAVPLTQLIGVRTVAWSPDGRRLAFNSIGPTGDWLASGALGLLEWPAGGRRGSRAAVAAAAGTSASDLPEPGRFLAPAARAQRVALRFLGANLDEHLELVDFFPDGRHVLAVGPQPFGRSLARVEVASGTGSWVSKPHAVYKQVAVAARSGDVAYVHESDSLAPTVCANRLVPPAADAPAAAPTRQTVRLLTVDRSQSAAQGRPVEFAWSAAADGTRTQRMVCWSVAKAGPKAAAARPLVVALHGGPMGSFANLYGPALEPAGLFPLRELADRRVHLAWINPRGSTGYGGTVRMANAGRLGEADADDVIAHLKALAADPRVDASRIALAGWSYGGFLAGRVAARLVEGPASEPGRLAVAAILLGGSPSDFFALYGACDVHGTLHRWIGGAPLERPDLWSRLTPPVLVEHWAAPTLIFHGTADTRVPFDQGQVLYRLLKARGTPCRLLAFHGAGHVLSEARALLTAHRECFAWLRRYLRTKL